MGLVLLLLFIPFQEKGNPVLILGAEIKRPSIYSRERPALEITLSNLGDKPIRSLTFEVEFSDYRHDRKADAIKGALGDINPKFVLLKAGQKKTFRHSLSDYYPLDNWTTDKGKIKILYISFSDGSAWIPEDK